MKLYHCGAFSEPCSVAYLEPQLTESQIAFLSSLKCGDVVQFDSHGDEIRCCGTARHWAAVQVLRNYGIDYELSFRVAREIVSELDDLT